MLVPFVIGDVTITGCAPGSASVSGMEAEIDAAVARGELTEAEASEARAAIERLEPVVGAGGDDEIAPDAV